MKIDGFKFEEEDDGQTSYKELNEKFDLEFNKHGRLIIRMSIFLYHLTIRFK